MIESKLKVKNANSGQLFRPDDFIDNCLHASSSILCGIHSADETQSGRTNHKMNANRKQIAVNKC